MHGLVWCEYSKKYYIKIYFLHSFLLKAKHKWPMPNATNKKTFYFEIIKYILDENQLLQAAQKKSFLCLILWICKWQATKHWTFLFIKCVDGYLRMRFFKKYDLANLFTSIHTKMINKLKPSGLSWNNLEHVRSISNKVDPLVPRLNHQQTD